MRRSRALFALLTLPLVLLLSGCIRYVAEFEIVSPDEVNVVFDFGLKEEAMRDADTNAADVCQETPFSDIPGAKIEQYAADADGYAGCRVEATAAVNEIGDDELQIELTDGVWHFRMTNQNEDATGSPEEAAQLISDFRVQVTFPGKVLTHNGTANVDGRTVTWTDPVDLMKPDGLQATAENPAIDVDAVLPWIIGGVGVLVVAGVVLAVVLARRKQTPPQPAQPPHQGYPPQY
ncbi:LppM family (lipo)protein [Enemella sp. A6]|uniref:LppM family (lipo)protein n=1 Tax=Enemella sp. A6 TaxID=3440152 RepID=UPI003EBCE0DF